MGNEAEILIMKSLVPLFCIILASLAAVEICRFFVLRKIRSTLVRYDGATSRILASHSQEGAPGPGSEVAKAKGVVRAARVARATRHLPVVDCQTLFWTKTGIRMMMLSST